MKGPDRSRVSGRKEPPSRRGMIAIERTLLVVGILLISIVLTAYLHRTIMVRSSMRSFEKARQEQAAAKPIGATGSKAKPESQDGLAGMSHERPEVVNGRRRVTAVQQKSGVPLAVLRIPGIHLEVPVLQGTDEITLNRAVGQIPGTAAPGEVGNIGIAGHRDSFFRNLKDINRGDEIELETTSASASYVVTRILVTGPDDTTVLESSSEPMLTLVTCYPFHFIGPAPRRFVVQATLK
jgi:sortase A